MIRLNHLALNQCHLNFSTDGEVGIPKKKGNGIPSAIRDSMVLWYDLKRQGATNDSMAANPVLRDLSGNGHDATCYNFAWSGMSGIGGYDVSINDFFVMASVDFHNDIRYECKQAEGNQYMLYTSGSTPHAAFKIKVSGLTKEVQYRYAPSGDAKNIEIFNILSDGEYEIPQSYVNSNIQTVGFLGRQLGIVIELVPLYPNALVSDGVDDYATVSNAPMFYNETGFTVIAKRKILTNIKNNPYSSLICDNTGPTDGAFLFEGLWYKTSAIQSFGGVNYDLIFPDLYSYMTSTTYNGKGLKKNDNACGNAAYTIFGCKINDKVYPSQYVLYSLLLFDRDLTDEEIKWVKDNLITE